MTNDQLRHPSARTAGYHVRDFDGHPAVYDPSGLLIAVFSNNLEAACRRAAWLNSPMREKVAKK